MTRDETNSKELENELKFGERIYDTITIKRNDGKVLIYKLISKEPIFISDPKAIEVSYLDEEPDLKNFEKIIEKKCDKSHIASSDYKWTIVNIDHLAKSLKKREDDKMRNYYYHVKAINHDDIPLSPYASLTEALKGIEEHHNCCFYYVSQYVKQGIVIPYNIRSRPYSLYLFMHRCLLNVNCTFLQEEAYLIAIQELSQNKEWEIFIKQQVE